MNNNTHLFQTIILRSKAVRVSIGVAALVLAGVGIFLGADFWKFYLTGFLFWTGLSVACLGILMLHHMVGGTWGVLIRRSLEAGSLLLLPMALFALPLVFGLEHVYHWMDPAHVAADPLLQHKAVYLNKPFFLIRAAIYFSLWIFLALRLVHWSSRQDERDDPMDAARQRRMSSWGTLALVLTYSFACFDWMMSVEPHWFSSVYGVLVIGGNGLCAFALTTFTVVMLRDKPAVAHLAKPAVFHDLGNLTFAFSMFWAYIVFSQYLIIWYGNLPEEMSWYHDRSHGGWPAVFLFTFALKFVIPFFALLMKTNKRNPDRLKPILILIILGHVLETAWLILPSIDSSVGLMHWPYVVVMAAMGAVWLSLYKSCLERRPLVPAHHRIELKSELHGH